MIESFLLLITISLFGAVLTFNSFIALYRMNKIIKFLQRIHYNTQRLGNGRESTAKTEPTT